MQLPVSTPEAQTNPGQSHALAAEQAPDDRSASRWAPVIIACTLLGMLLEAADQTIVSAAAPKIMSDLAGFNSYAWVTTAYLLGITVTMPVYGKLADLYDAKRIFLFGALLFVAASALCGLSHSMIELVLFRALQGAGAGALAPVGVVIMSNYVTPERRAGIQGTAGGIFLMATVAGPVVGGWLTDHGGWHLVFYINVPLGLLVAGCLAALLPATRGRRGSHHIDYAGAALLILGVVPLLVVVGVPSHERAAFGPGLVWALLAGELVILTAFVSHESRTAEPIIDPRLLLLRPFVVMATTITLLSAITFGSLVYIPLYLQGVLGATATHGGLVLAPLMLASISARFVTNWLREHRGRVRATTLCSLGLVALGAVLLFVMRPTTSGSLVVVAMVLLGAGLGAANMLLFAGALAPFPRYRFGQATGTLLFLRSLGGALVTGTLGVVLSTRFTAAMTAALPGHAQKLLHTRLGAVLENPRLALLPLDHVDAGRHPLLYALRHVIRLALATSLHEIFGVLLAMAVVAAAIMLLFPVRMTRQAGERAALVAEGGVAALGELAPGGAEEANAPSVQEAAAVWDIMCHVLYWRYGAVQFRPRDESRVFNAFEDHVTLATSLRDPAIAAIFARAWPGVRADTPLDRYRAESIVDLLYRARGLDGDVAICGDGGGGLAVLLAMVIRELRLAKRVCVYPGHGDTGGSGVLDQAQVLWPNDGAAPSSEPRSWACICIEHDDYDSTRACLDGLLGAATPGAAVIVGHYHNTRDGARRAADDTVGHWGGYMVAGPLPQAYWHVPARVHAGSDAARVRVEWSHLGDQPVYAAFLRWVADELGAVYQAQDSIRNRHIALSLAKLRLGQRADRYLTRFIGAIFGPPDA